MEEGLLEFASVEEVDDGLEEGVMVVHLCGGWDEAGRGLEAGGDEGCVAAEVGELSDHLGEDLEAEDLDVAVLVEEFFVVVR